MSEQPSQPHGPAPQPTGNTESDAAGQLGEQVGRFAVLAVRRLEQMASAGAAMAAQTPPARRTAQHGEADERDVSRTGSRAADEPAPDSATARAEALVDTAGAQLGTLATLVTHQLRRAAALAREEAEDIWAEAQQIRAARRRDPDEGQGRGIS